MKEFVKGLFLDDVKEPCIGRVALFLGLMLTPFTACWALGAPGEVTWAEAIARGLPGIIGLCAYIFTRAAEMKEWIAEVAQKLRKK